MTPTLSSPCGCKGLPSRSLRSLPARGQPCQARPAQRLQTMADRERGATNRPHSRVLSPLFLWPPQYRWVWDRLLVVTAHPSSVPSQGYRGDFQGDPTLSPSQERDFSLHGGNPTASGSAPVPLLPPRPPTCHTAQGNGNAP